MTLWSIKAKFHQWHRHLRLGSVKECHRLGPWLINKCGTGSTLRYIPDWQAVALDSSCQHFGLREGCSCCNPFRVEGRGWGLGRRGGNQCQIRFTRVMSVVIQHYSQQIHTGILVLNWWVWGGGVEVGQMGVRNKPQFVRNLNQRWLTNTFILLCYYNMCIRNSTSSMD